MSALLFGDCLDLLGEVSTGSVDMILADLPYGTTRNAWDSVIDLDRLWPEYLRVAKPNAAIVLFAQPPFDKVLAMSKMRLFRHEWIWEKTSATGHLNAKRMPMKAHENILVFYRKLPTYNPQMTKGHARKVSTVEHKRNTHFSTNYGRFLHKGYDSTERFPRDVLVYPSDKQKSKLHPTQKPLALCEYLIRTYTNPGETVLDNVAGSGTTALAAFNLGREFIAMENDPVYYARARERLETASWREHSSSPTTQPALAAATR